jgi:hypothetical protein
MNLLENFELSETRPASCGPWKENTNATQRSVLVINSSNLRKLTNTTWMVWSHFADLSWQFSLAKDALANHSHVQLINSKSTN